MRSPKSVSTLAREGAYVVQQPCNSAQEWISVGDPGYTNTPGTTFGQCVLSMMRVRGTTDQTHNFVYLNNGSFPMASPTFTSQSGLWSDTPWNNLDWTFVLFEGLTVPQTGSMTGSPMITVKVIEGAEIAPSFKGSLTAFQKQNPLCDTRALTSANNVFHARPDSLPSSANDFGTIGAALMTMLPTVGRLLGSVFTHKGQNARAKSAPGTSKGTAKAKPKGQVKQKLKGRGPKPKTGNRPRKPQGDSVMAMLPQIAAMMRAMQPPPQKTKKAGGAKK